MITSIIANLPTYFCHIWLQIVLNCRPGNVEHFGYGNVVTGQVASRKYEILTSRASSVGRFEEREGLNPDLARAMEMSSHSARASPAPMQLTRQLAAEEVSASSTKSMSVQVN